MELVLALRTLLALLGGFGVLLAALLGLATALLTALLLLFAFGTTTTAVGFGFGWIVLCIVCGLECG